MCLLFINLPAKEDDRQALFCKFLSLHRDQKSLFTSVCLARPPLDGSLSKVEKKISAADSNNVFYTTPESFGCKYRRERTRGRNDRPK